MQFETVVGWMSVVGFALSLLLMGLVIWREAHIGWKTPYVQRMFALLSVVVACIGLWATSLPAKDVVHFGDTRFVDTEPMAEAAIHNMHPALTEGISAVRGGGLPDIAKVFKSKDTIGMYSPMSATIYVEENVSEQVYYHEVGHHVWTKLDKDAQEEWREHYKKYPELIPTEYAHTNVYEDFADSFEIWFDGIAAINLDPWRVDFLDRHTERIMDDYEARHS